MSRIFSIIPFNQIALTLLFLFSDTPAKAIYFPPPLNYYKAYTSECLHWSVSPAIKNYSFIKGPDQVYSTIFIGGAGFKGKVKEKKRKKKFTHNIILTYRDIIPAIKYKTAKNSVRFLGVARNSTYTMKFGFKPLTDSQFNKRKHKALRKTTFEILDKYKANNGIDSAGQQTAEPLNIVGSSYGSVIAGQAAIYMIEKESLQINTLTLSSSAINIDEPNGLGQQLFAYEASGKIKNIIWHPTPDDDITGASGKTSVCKLIFQGFKKDKKSILSPRHPHNKASKNINRSKEIITLTLIDLNSEEDPLIKRIAENTLNIHF